MNIKSNAIFEVQVKNLTWSQSKKRKREKDSEDDDDDERKICFKVGFCVLREICILVSYSFVCLVDLNPAILNISIVVLVIFTGEVARCCLFSST